MLNIGSVPEWLKGPVLKTGIPERVSKVRILPLPPSSAIASFGRIRTGKGSGKRKFSRSGRWKPLGFQKFCEYKILFESFRFRQNMKNHYKLLIAFIGGILFGFLIFYLARNVFVEQNRGNIIREGVNDLINPILSCEIGTQETFKELSHFKTKIQNVVDKVKRDNDNNNVSVYFRLMNSGRWLGVNENTTFIPASLLKILIMIAYFKEAETAPKILSQKIIYDIKNAISETETSLLVGETYTIEDLINIMIKKSDNGALSLLVLNMKNVDIINKVFVDFSIPLPVSGTSALIESLSPKDYSLVWRTLYGASYLNRDMSNKVLHILSETEFKYGLVQNLPSEVVVSHKFGIRLSNLSEKKELHDCGIIYYPDHPYFLCVMTKGDDKGILQKIIADISLLVWDETNIFFKNN